ncbi:hypothetical protein R1T16_14750 [Flavobacterium sp. DG1-102-2]|uniref:hypothetical protein n=1 Tax=Flavobacterium sp. DG1-102-2 TaxID=3081663 RepID=UPI00294A1EA0|nr:hypothetical protein [Flavobacterium sp. DG1-102-2]MDV6169693.1 hypothetical protein [Flavobacterium sp. DG1-102-2]
MKTSLLRNTIMASVLLASLSLTSCKHKEETTTDTETIDTTEETRESPIDTVVKDNDTIIDTGGASDSKENPAGTQVP